MRKHTGGLAFGGPYIFECSELFDCENARAPDTKAQCADCNGTGLIEGTGYGMTLRDWFAGQALAAQSAMPFRFRAPPKDCALGVAERCYALADAMLAERKRKRGGNDDA